LAPQDVTGGKGRGTAILGNRSDHIERARNGNSISPQAVIAPVTVMAAAIGQLPHVISFVCRAR